MRTKLGLSDDVAILPDDLDRQVQSWDCTFKNKETSDYVAGHVLGQKAADYYLLDRHHERMGIVETMKAIQSMTIRWHNAHAKYVEDKANGSAVIEMLQKKITGMVPVNPDGGKEVRSYAVAPFWEAGNVYLPHPLWKQWSDEILDELESFPNGAHDDDVDAMTQALVKMSKPFEVKDFKPRMPKIRGRRSKD